MSTSAPFSREEYTSRVACAAAALEKARVDVLVAFANKVMPGHVRYLSGAKALGGRLGAEDVQN